MGFSRFSTIPQQGIVVRTGEERATLVRRTYALVFASVLVTIGAAAWTMTQPALLDAVRFHPFITVLCVFAPLIGAQLLRNSFPQNIGMVFLFAFAEGIYIALPISIMEAAAPGVAMQAGALTFA